VFCGPGHGTRRSPTPQAGPCFAADKTRRIRCIVEVEALAAEEARLHSLYQSRGLALDLQDMRSNFDSSLGASESIGDLNKGGCLQFHETLVVIEGPPFCPRHRGTQWHGGNGTADSEAVTPAMARPSDRRGDRKAFAGSRAKMHATPNDRS
jgi:hypothetical protein